MCIAILALDSNSISNLNGWQKHNVLYTLNFAPHIKPKNKKPKGGHSHFTLAHNQITIPLLLPSQTQDHLPPFPPPILQFSTIQTSLFLIPTLDPLLILHYLQSSSSNPSISSDFRGIQEEVQVFLVSILIFFFISSKI